MPLNSPVEGFSSKRNSSLALNILILIKKNRKKINILELKNDRFKWLLKQRRRFRVKGLSLLNKLRGVNHSIVRQNSRWESQRHREIVSASFLFIKF